MGGVLKLVFVEVILLLAGVHDLATRDRLLLPLLRQVVGNSLVPGFVLVFLGKHDIFFSNLCGAEDVLGTVCILRVNEVDYNIVVSGSGHVRHPVRATRFEVRLTNVGSTLVGLLDWIQLEMHLVFCVGGHARMSAPTLAAAALT